MKRWKSESRDPESRSEKEFPLNELVLTSTDDGRSMSSVDVDSDLPPPDQSRGREILESRDPHDDGRTGDVHYQPKGGERIDVNKICQEMEQAMEQRFRRLDETWNQVPLIIADLQRHVDATKNMDSSVFQIETRSILTNDEAETMMTMFSIDEALNLTASASKELDNSIESSFPILRAYVSHLESTSTFAIAELLVDDEIGSLGGASSQEAFISAQSCTESFSEDLALLAQLSFTQNDDNAEKTCTQTRDIEDSVPACIPTVGRTSHPFVDKVTTSEPAIACRISCVESPTTSISREAIHSQDRLSLMQNDDNDNNIQAPARQNLESVHSCRNHSTTAESPSPSISKEDIDFQSKFPLLQSEDNSLDIQILTSYTAESERYVLSEAPSDETANSTQSCTEIMSLSILRAELYCQDVNLCFENTDDGIPTQNDPKLSNMPAMEKNRQTSHQYLTWCWQTLQDLTLFLSQTLDDLNAKWEHACVSCDRCLSIALTGSLPAPA